VKVLWRVSGFFAQEVLQRRSFSGLLVDNDIVRRRLLRLYLDFQTCFGPLALFGAILLILRGVLDIICKLKVSLLDRLLLDVLLALLGFSCGLEGFELLI